MKNPGFVDGRHYTDYVEEIKPLKRIGKFGEAEKSLLNKLIEAVQQETCLTHQGVAPWHYE